MNKNTIIIAIVILGFAGVVLYLLSQGNTASNSSSIIVPSTNSGQDAVVDDQGLDSNSRYVEYSKDILDNVKDKRRVLYFYANWCPTCRPADANFKENVGKIPEDVVLIRVNYNDSDTDQEEKDLAQKYGITYQHTFVQIDDQGNEIAKWNGGQINELLNNIR